MATSAFKRYIAILLLGLAILSCACLCACGTNKNFSSSEASSEADVSPSCTIDILNVGKADCIVINTGSRLLMIDTGESENFPVIHSYMAQHEYTKIDMLILTHFDKDHIGGVSSIVSAYEVGMVIESSFTSTSEIYLSYHNALSEKDIKSIKLTQNYSFSYDGCEFEIDIPKKSKYKTKQDNNSSLIISLRCGERSFLFCGDAMELRLAELIASPPDSYDFVKLPYHGNYLENYREFLDAISPSYGAITCSKKNPASAEALALLEEYGVEVYQTRYGAISVSTDGEEIIIQ